MSFAYIINVIIVLYLTVITTMIVSRLMRAAFQNISDTRRSKKMREIADSHRDEYLYHQR